MARRTSLRLLALGAGLLRMGAAQQPPMPAPVQLSAGQDHQRLMDLLHIASLRRGADGRNREAPNAANYDESKANEGHNASDVVERATPGDR